MVVEDIVVQVVPLVASFLSIVLNCLLIYVAYTRAQSVVGLYRYMMIATSSFDLCFSIVSMIASPTIAAVSNESSVLFVKAGLKMPLSSGRFLLVCWIYLLCLSIVIPPCNFLFRYIQVCRTHLVQSYHRRVFAIFITPILLAIIGATLLGFSAWPSPRDILIFESIAFGINTNTSESFLVASLLPREESLYRPLSALKSVVLLVAFFYLIIVLIISVAVMIFCSHYIVVVFRKATSRKTKHMQQRLHRLLIVQFIIPFFFIHTPFYLCCLAPLFQMDTGVVADYLPILFAWSPAINPLVVMYFVRDFRKSIKTIFSPAANARIFTSTM